MKLLGEKYLTELYRIFSRSVKTLFEWMLRKNKGLYEELVEEYNRINNTDFVD